jgi:cytochrome b pre-mRNA-processing protein 3
MVPLTASPAVSISNEAGVASFLRKRTRHERAAFTLYGAAVGAARDPYLYETLGVPDTLDGRFDTISLHVFLLIRRLTPDGDLGRELAQGVFDAMFTDMDINLREMGVSDLSVGRRNRAMWEALHGRAAAYTESWDDPVRLAASIARNVWRGALPPEGAAPALARLAHAQAAHLAAQPIEALAKGEAHYLSAQEAAQ